MYICMQKKSDTNFKKNVPLRNPFWVDRKGRDIKNSGKKLILEFV